MKVEPARLLGALIIHPDVFGDERGFFMEMYHEAKFAELGVTARFVQDNYSRSVKGTLRGLHFQNPSAQGKLIRVTVGAVFDVAVDIRRGSPTFGQWIGIELNDDNKLGFYIPTGFAHGFCVLSDVAEFMYKCTDFYSREHEHGIRWDDPAIGVEWPVKDPLLSPKDQALPGLDELEDALFR